MYFYLVALGSFVGLISSFFGVGGGVAIVPMLYFLFPAFTPSTVIGCSLGVICVNSLINSYNFYKIGKKPNYKMAFVLGLGMVIGTLVATQFVTLISPRSIKMVFAITLVIITFKTIFTKTNKDSSSEFRIEETSRNYIVIAISGLLGGIVAGFTGLGGGIILVPLMIHVLKAPLNWVPVYSNAAMVMGTLAGTINYILLPLTTNPLTGTSLERYQLGSVNLALILIIFSGAFLTSRLGAKYSQKISPRVSKWSFVVMILFFAGRIFITTFQNS